MKAPPEPLEDTTRDGAERPRGERSPSAEKLITNPELLLIQSRLYNEAYSGPGKWILFNPRTRRALLAAGKDRIPEVLAVLVRAAASAQTAEELASVATGRTVDHVLELERAGLLEPARAPHVEPSRSYLSLYHLANFNYPFQDYFDPNWRELDQARMHQYAKLWPVPPKLTERTGALLELPRVGIDSLGTRPRRRRREQELTLRELAAVLRFTLGPIGEIDGDFGPWLRKTSPSGGAKHPTECVVLLHDSCGEIPAGAYAYDVARHGLLAAPAYRAEATKSAAGGVRFLIRSRVERPMWRYRDIRALRPVVLDSGHIVETLMLLLGHIGVETKVDLPPISPDLEFGWLREPELALVSTGAQPAESGKSRSSSLAWDAGNNAHYLTNPSLCFTFNQSGLMGQLFWPEERRFSVDLDDFMALTHALPSRRRDRLTTIDGMRKAAGVTERSARRLVEEFALLPVDVGTRFYTELHLWVRHGWYLSALAHLAVRARLGSSSQRADLPLSRARLAQFGNDDLVRSLLERRTTRAFVGQSIPLDSLLRVLMEASAVRETGRGTENGIRMLVNAFSVDGLAEGLYEWCRKGDRLVPIGRSFGRDEVRALTIGQAPAAAGSVTLWLIRRLRLTASDLYELQILELGRVGQRICVSATAEKLGVFETPAVSDRATYEALGIVDAEEEYVVYTFSIGRPASRCVVGPNH